LRDVSSKLKLICRNDSKTEKREVSIITKYDKGQKRGNLSMLFSKMRISQETLLVIL
jgi:hypothetical protein